MGHRATLSVMLTVVILSMSVNAIEKIADIEERSTQSIYESTLEDEEPNSIENLDDLKPEKSVKGKGIGKIVAFIVGSAILVIIITVVCCCCCPFCMLAKRKERGRVLREGPAQQPQNTGIVQQQAYAVPPEQYHQQVPHQQSYQPGGFNQPMPHSGPYPNQAAPQAYMMDQPPPYPGPPIQQNQTQQAAGQFQAPHKTEYQQQPAYNPNAL